MNQARATNSASETTPVRLTGRQRSARRGRGQESPAGEAPGPSPDRAGTCQGTVRGADLPLPRAMRAEIVELLAAALVADFVGDSWGDGPSPRGNEPKALPVGDAEHVGVQVGRHVSGSRTEGHG